MSSKWQKCECSICQSTYLIHLDWKNAPKKCKRCRLEECDLVDAIDTILVTKNFDAPQSLKDRLKECTDSSALYWDAYALVIVDKVLSKMGILNSANNFQIGMKFLEVESILINLVNQKSGRKKIDRFLEEALQIESALDPNGSERDKLINIRLAFLIADDNELFKSIMQAVNLNRRFSKIQTKINNKNENRSGLITDGKRRIS
jgi:hypothetical protein